jgi:hypothetical protein
VTGPDRPDLNLAGNMFGPLDGDARARLTAAIKDPCEATWVAAHSLILNPNVGLGLTLWQAVLAVDPGFSTAQAPVARWADDDGPNGGHSVPVSGWSRTPSAETIRQAIEYATH